MYNQCISYTVHIIYSTSYNVKNDLCTEETFQVRLFLSNCGGFKKLIHCYWLLDGPQLFLLSLNMIVGTIQSTQFYTFLMTRTMRTLGLGGHIFVRSSSKSRELSKEPKCQNGRWFGFKWGDPTFCMTFFKLKGG